MREALTGMAWTREEAERRPGTDWRIEFGLGKDAQAAAYVECSLPTGERSMESG
jgi:hypothetical protein